MAEKDRGVGLAPVSFWGPLSMMQEMDRMMRDFRLGFDAAPFMAAVARMPAMDIRDEGNGYSIEAELPGMKKEEVSVEIGEKALVIKAERESSGEEKGEGYMRQERGRSSFYRQVPLPSDIDHAQASAKLEDGLLRITLPKRTEQAPGRKKLDIQ